MSLAIWNMSNEGGKTGNGFRSIIQIILYSSKIDSSWVDYKVLLIWRIQNIDNGSCQKKNMYVINSWALIHKHIHEQYN